MVALWLLLMLVTIWGVVLLWQNKLQDVRLYQYLALWSVPAPILSSTLGWMTAEIGRQPWAVYGLLKTADAVSPVVSAAEVAFSLSLLSLIYIGLFCVWFFLIRKKLHEGPEEEAQAAEQGATA
jgi:cytochrome d ubiquinol oxidase subunit I